MASSDSTWLMDDTDNSSSTNGSSEEAGGNAGGNGVGDPAVNRCDQRVFPFFWVMLAPKERVLPPLSYPGN